MSDDKTNSAPVLPFEELRVPYPLDAAQAVNLMEKATIYDPEAGLHAILARGPDNITPDDILRRRAESLSNADLPGRP